MYASPERKLLFDVNDFDETLPGPWEWDVKRLAASLEVAARGNGFARKDRRIIVQAAAAGYREVMRRLAATNNLDVWYTDVDIEGFRREFAGRLSTRQRKTLDKALRRREDTTAGRHLTSCARSRMGSCASWPTRRWWCRSLTCFPSSSTTWRWRPSCTL